MVSLSDMQMELPTLRDRTIVDDAKVIIEKAYENCYTKCKAAWIHYQYWIIGALLVFICGLVIVLVLVSSKTYNYPCL